MLHNGMDLRKYGIEALDGEIGKVHDFFFDDEDLKVRYLVVDTAKWLPGRKVLISPLSIEKVDHQNKNVKVLLTKDEIRNSPDVDTDQPISRKYEEVHARYYGYHPYWIGGGGAGPMAYPTNEIVDPEVNEIDTPETNLRSVNEVTGYHVGAVDGDIGHIEDVIFSNEGWDIEYFIVDTKNWWPGKKVYLSPKWVMDISWNERKVYVDLLQETIKNSPEYHSEEIREKVGWL